jgi:hypothetical protein
MAGLAMFHGDVDAKSVKTPSVKKYSLLGVNEFGQISNWPGVMLIGITIFGQALSLRLHQGLI